jgi:hypothetical protein
MLLYEIAAVYSMKRTKLHALCGQNAEIRAGGSDH